MRERSHTGARLHHAVVDEGGCVYGVFPHGEIGLGQANEFLAGEGGRGRVVIIPRGSPYRDVQERTIIHGLEPAEGIPADNVMHGSERLIR